MTANINTYASSNQVSWLKKSFSDLTWSEVNNSVTCPKEICRLVHGRIQYKDDEIDFKQAGEATWTQKQGDCEDLAECVVSICKYNHFSARIEIFYEKGNSIAHAVAMGEYEGKLWISSNGSFQYVKDMQEAKLRIARDLGWNRKLTMNTPWTSKKSDNLIASNDKSINSIH